MAGTARAPAAGLSRRPEKTNSAHSVWWPMSSCSGTRSIWTRHSTNFAPTGHDVRDEDIARLSPLGVDHINVLGRYAFTLSDTVSRGELRRLRDPIASRDDEG